MPRTDSVSTHPTPSASSSRPPASSCRLPWWKTGNAHAGDTELLGGEQLGRSVVAHGIYEAQPASASFIKNCWDVICCRWKSVRTSAVSHMSVGAESIAIRGSRHGSPTRRMDGGSKVRRRSPSSLQASKSLATYSTKIETNTKKYTRPRPQT